MRYETAGKESLLKNNKVYFQKDALSRHEDFDMWYEDGDLFLRFEGDWSQEKSKKAVIGRMGGEIGCIKPDHKTVNYYLREGRWEHCLHTYTILSHYYVEGMSWDIYSSMDEVPFDFIDENKEGGASRPVHVKLVNFRDKGECYEIRVKDLSHLRIASIAVVGIAMKEEFKGLSEGEEYTGSSKLQKIKQNVLGLRGKTYEEVMAEREAAQEACRG